MLKEAGFLKYDDATDEDMRSWSIDSSKRPFMSSSNEKLREKNLNIIALVGEAFEKLLDREIEMQNKSENSNKFFE
jgi:hypothetical protein